MNTNTADEPNLACLSLSLTERTLKPQWAHHCIERGVQGVCGGKRQSHTEFFWPNLPSWVNVVVCMWVIPTLGTWCRPIKRPYLNIVLQNSGHMCIYGYMCACMCVYTTCMRYIHTCIKPLKSTGQTTDFKLSRWSVYGVKICLQSIGWDPYKVIDMGEWSICRGGRLERFYGICEYVYICACIIVLVAQRGSTIKSPWVRTVTSRYLSLYELKCC